MKCFLSALVLLAGAGIPTFAQRNSPANSNALPLGQVVVTHVFNGPGESPDPQYGLLEMADGDFVGVTQGTGDLSGASRMIYRMAANGQVTVLATFPNASGELGYHVYEGTGSFQPIQASDGNIYGVTNGQFPDFGNLFRMTPDGIYSVLYEFSAASGGISAAQGGVAEGIDGGLYGFGGGNGPGGWGIYRVDPRTGVFRWVYYDTTGLFLPVGTPVFTSGTQLYGISSVSPVAQSSVFSFNTATAAFTTVATLTVDQAYARAFSDPLVVAPGGGIWFSTLQSNFTQPGCPPDCSNIIQVAGGSAVVRQTFPAGFGIYAPVSLIFGSDGNFYGDEYNAASSSPRDSIFKFLPSTNSLGFFVSPERSGTAPTGQLTEDANGFLRGTHGGGQGTNAVGSTFVLNLGLPRPLPAIRAFRPLVVTAGTVVTVLGSHFVNVTAVTLNGVPVPFRNIASGVVRVFIPAGASTGLIGIMTAAGTGFSAARLRVN